MEFVAIPDYTPASLSDLCYEYLATHLETISVVDPQTKERRLKEGVMLPLYFCEKLVEFHQQTGESLDDGFVTIFENTETTLLKKVRLRNAGITDCGLRILLRHNLKELELDNCQSITKDSLQHINEFGDNLFSLVIGPLVHVLTYPDQSSPFLSLVIGRLLHVLGLTNPFDPLAITFNNLNILQTPNLHRLTVRDVHTSASFFPLLLKPLPNLDHLDLSGCCDLGDLSYLCKLENLSSLVLHNVEDVQDKLTSICMLKKLRHLDISSPKEEIGEFHNPNKTLALIVDCLPLLTSLDISGTNLAGTGTKKGSHASRTRSKTVHESTAPRTDIPGLASRVNNPLEFLGLYKTNPRACHRRSIPAKKISGDANESQIMTAATAYIDRPAVLRYVLIDLTKLYLKGKEISSNVCQVLDFLLWAMDRHVQNWDIQRDASHLLMHIIRDKYREMIPTRMERKIMGTTLTLMNIHRDDEQITEHFLGILYVFCNKDLFFHYKGIIERLTHVVLNKQLSCALREFGSFLLVLYSFASPCDHYDDDDYQRILGELGVIKLMLCLIEDQIENKMYDDIFKNAFIVIYAATDHMYDNCQRFVDGDGLEIILRCIKDVVIQRKDILRSMVPILVNVAEIESLRPRMMTSQLVTVFFNLLDFMSDANEVSYALVAALSGMVSGRPADWTISNPKREDVLRRMVSAIESWDLKIDIGIIYRSVYPILQLVQVYHTPECQHWAVWTLAHLTRRKPSLYCPMVEEEGGIPLLEEVVTHEEPYSRIKELAYMAIKNCRKYNIRTGAGAAPGVGSHEPPL